MRFCVFASGFGSNLQAVIDAVKKGTIKAELALVFSNNPKAKALVRAKEAGIKTFFLDPKSYAAPQSYDREVVIQLKAEKIDFIVLAGYMRMLTPWFVNQYPNKIINVHPSLLPAFKGANGIKDSFTYGAKVTGATVHFVDEKTDHGPIILQEAFKLRERETMEEIASRVHKIEHKILPKAIAFFAEGKLKISGRKVIVLERPRGGDAKAENDQT